MKPITIFYAGQVYEECDRLRECERIELPDGVILYLRDDVMKKLWYRKDLTPILLEDVPKVLRATVLILT